MITAVVPLPASEVYGQEDAEHVHDHVHDSDVRHALQVSPQRFRFGYLTSVTGWLEHAAINTGAEPRYFVLARSERHRRKFCERDAILVDVTLFNDYGEGAFLANKQDAQEQLRTGIVTEFYVSEFVFGADHPAPPLPPEDETGLAPATKLVTAVKQLPNSDFVYRHWGVHLPAREESLVLGSDGNWERLGYQVGWRITDIFGDEWFTSRILVVSHEEHLALENTPLPGAPLDAPWWWQPERTFDTLNNLGP